MADATEQQQQRTNAASITGAAFFIGRSSIRKHFRRINRSPEANP
jgi:hypothetical protein